MGETWSIVIGSLGFTALLVMPFIVNKIIKFKLEIARINAETTIRAEEIRSRNQLEFEKYLRQEEKGQDSENAKAESNNYRDDGLYENSNKSRVRA